MARPAGLVCAAACVAAAVVIAPPRGLVRAAGQTDLDALMGRVLAHRDENWKKLQQYILEEHDAIDVRGPSKQPIWGDKRDYQWFVKDGYFVQSPLRANGVTIADADRRKAEDEYLKRVKQRDAQRARGQRAGGAGASNNADPSAAPADVGDLLKQSREPDFISSAYFLRFKFEEGKYVFVGHESLEGRDLLRIEYYPSRLFSHEQDLQRRRQQGAPPPARGRGQRDTRTPAEQSYDVAIEAAMSKVSLVTLWVDPKEAQIVKYTFDNVDLDFLPAAWLVRVDALNASMTMSQPFPGVWLPRNLQIAAGATLAIGHIDFQYTVDYVDYRLASGTAKIIRTPYPEER